MLFDLGLSGIDFSGADLATVKFYSVDLSGANFTGAKLDHTLFSACDLTGAGFLISLGRIAPPVVPGGLRLRTVMVAVLPMNFERLSPWT